ncbi:beta-N-acetylhexosaminidase [Curtobacterium flaccumfaciens]|uniref:beta-N-acetylhexosaminidase n=1 Tax=Curtobacterium flaccumfaciens TaxID=2035 RepID=UPI001BDE8C10|nr:beta-N-acetylhexosaminidase [Curtobacterium flaccumfaciens]MBT1633415.1 family 20 glycosylhydrolase [Curtobacterium flaccumfaciens pv. oortii]MCX2846342.1 beta-N-acetylhexosaminidase [Curtobacterium flaccumfaciens pv. oortii]
MLVPRPRRTAPGVGAFEITPSTRIAADPASESVRLYLQQTLRGSTGLPVRDALDDTAPGAGTIALRVADDPSLPAGPTTPEGDRVESFRLTVTPDGIDVVGGSPAGVFYGVQALLQLLPPDVYRSGRVATGPWSVPAVVVEDAPAFAWRGVMLDVARHFRTKHEVMRVVDQLAAHRINRLHFHLTEDQGWRIEIRKYPRLTEVGSWRRESQVGAHVPGPDGTLVVAGFDGRPHGGYYTQDDVREIVAYAADRFVTVVPEIETPGHVRAALAAYPSLGVTGEPVEVWTQWGIADDVLNAEDATIEFFKDVLDEVIALFPSGYIGIGGDECPKVQWETDLRTQERIRELGLQDEEQLQAWIIGQLAAHVESHGRRAFGWDEILEGGTLDPSATVVSWRGLTGARTAARRGHDVISSPDDQVYLDYRQSDLPTEPIPVSIVLTVDDVFAFDPVPSGLTDAERAHVIGGQGNMWTEHVDSARRLDYQLFPRVAALAEALWSADVTGPRDLAEFRGRLAEHTARLEAMGIEYRHEAGPFPWEQRPGVPGRPHSREERAAYIDAVTANITE